MLAAAATSSAAWLHVLFGITWIGLLYFFNVVQVPAYAQMEAGGSRLKRCARSPSGRCGGSAGPRCSRS